MLPEEVLKARLALGLTVEEFARIMNVSTVAVKYWESGHRRMQGSSIQLLKIYLEFRGLAPHVLRG